MEEESKAVQEVAKTTGKAIDAAREAGGFIARFISGSLEQGMGIFEDRLRYTRWERRVRLMKRADEFLAQQGLIGPTKAIPLKFAVPLFQAATLEDNDELQDKWAILLVNAATNSGLNLHRSFIDILEQLTPLEAKILDILYSLPFEKSQHVEILTAALPGSAQVKAEKQEKFVEPSEEVMLALGNLARLGCLRPSMTSGGGESFERVNPTVLGRSFVKACQLSPA
ncbi:MAG: Abi-alpha family protein [Acidovorax sp.]